MTSINLESMRTFLSSSISSHHTRRTVNRNKVNGLLAEIELRTYLDSLGFGDRISVGGWIVRSEGLGNFGHTTAVLFPQTIESDASYPTDRVLPEPSHGLHTICSTFHQIGIESYFCAPVIERTNDAQTISWFAIQLGLPTQQNYEAFPENISGFNRRTRRYNFLRYKTDVSSIPEEAISEEFTKEHIRIAFQNSYFCEISDVDGIFWGQQYTYPIEIKEKTQASDNRIGNYFGLDVGPFVKLAFYAAKRGNLHSIFIVREIDNTTERNLVNWWYITFEQLAAFASWNPRAGGTSMTGGASTTVPIPKSEFQALDRDSLASL